jgi:periplasmic protein TonB
LGTNTTFSDYFPLADKPTNAPPRSSKLVIIPEDVTVGMLIHKVDPEFPKIAKAARISGIVTLKATITKAGDISNLRAECGPELLKESSLKAVREWKYRPYLVRGEPVEVETTIKVRFALGGKKQLPFSKDSCPID